MDESNILHSTTYDPVVYNKTISDERTFIETPCTSGSFIARTTGTLSAISSALIILMVLRSSQRLSITYHRIMLGMSISDIVASVAMALTTLPMPKDMIYTQFEGRYIGSTLSCFIQSVIITWGSVTTLFYNVMLCIHFRQTISGKVTGRKMRKGVEVILHLMCIGLPTLSNAALAMSRNTKYYMNPSPQMPWCAAARYPYWCKEDDVDCTLLRSGELSASGYYSRARLTGYITYGVGDLIVIIYMVSIVRSARLIDESLTRDGNANNVKDEEDAPATPRSRPTASFSKVVTMQASAYVLALLITHSAIVVRSRSLYAEYTNTAMIYYMLTRPLQGFFNFVVFTGDKAYSYRRNNSEEEITMSKAVFHVLTKPIVPKFIFSHLSMLKREDDACGEASADEFIQSPPSQQKSAIRSQNDIPSASYPSSRSSHDPSAGLSYGSGSLPTVSEYTSSSDPSSRSSHDPPAGLSYGSRSLPTVSEYTSPSNPSSRSSHDPSAGLSYDSRSLPTVSEYTSPSNPSS